MYRLRDRVMDEERRRGRERIRRDSVQFHKYFTSMCTTKVLIPHLLTFLKHNFII
jgi:hypothetical protein